MCAAWAGERGPFPASLTSPGGWQGVGVVREREREEERRRGGEGRRGEERRGEKEGFFLLSSTCSFPTSLCSLTSWFFHSLSLFSVPLFPFFLSFSISVTSLFPLFPFLILSPSPLPSWRGLVLLVAGVPSSKVKHGRWQDGRA